MQQYGIAYEHARARAFKLDHGFLIHRATEHLTRQIARVPYASLGLDIPVIQIEPFDERLVAFINLCSILLSSAHVILVDGDLGHRLGIRLDNQAREALLDL